MPARDLIQACLAELDAPDDMRELWHAAKTRATALLGTPGVPSALVAAMLDSTRTDRRRHLELFEVLIGQARLDVQSRGRLGERFLKQSGSTIEAMIIGGVLDRDTANNLTLAYARARARPPAGLAALVMPEVTALADSGRYAGRLDTEVDHLHHAFAGDICMVHMALNDRFRILAPEARAAVVRNIAGREEDHCGRLALYWLLDASAEVRLAAASALHARVQRGIVDAAFVALMTPVASWIPPDDAGRVLDAASRDLRDLRRRGPFSPLRRSARRPSRVFALLPEDGGDQGFVAVLESGDNLTLAVLTTAIGCGLENAFVLEDETARAFLSEREADPDTLCLSWETFEPVLAFAVAEGLAAGRPPAAGLIDVALACDLGALRPRPMAARDWLSVVDPEGELAGLPARDRDRLVERSGRWPEDHALVGTWAEGTMLMEPAMNDAAGGPGKPAPAFWARLEERREGWALPMLLSAHLLKGAGREDWRSFAATASALLEGRALGTIPIMQHVFHATLDAWHAEEGVLRAHCQSGPA